MTTGKQPIPRLSETIATAARMLLHEADLLRRCHTLRGQWGDDDQQARADYDEMIQTARQLIKAHRYMRESPLGGPAKVFDACADAIRAGEKIDNAMAEFGLAWQRPE